jgi:hypothetical protein
MPRSLAGRSDPVRGSISFIGFFIVEGRIDWS